MCMYLIYKICISYIHKHVYFTHMYSLYAFQLYVFIPYTHIYIHTVHKYIQRWNGNP